jgi:thioester reductase-like protein
MFVKPYATARTVIVAGATGLVGQEILQGLLADQTVAVVHCLGRKSPAIAHPKLILTWLISPVYLSSHTLMRCI